MKKAIVFLSSLFVLISSCSKEDNQDVINEEAVLQANRVVFKDWDEFERTKNELEESKSDDYIMNWIFEKGHTSLYVNSANLEDEKELANLENLSNSSLAIFNENYEFQIGDEIISYENGVFFSQKLLDEKSGELDAKRKIGQTKSYYVSVANDDTYKLNDGAKVSINSNGGYGALQDKEFTKYYYDDCTSSYTSGFSTRRWKYRQMLKVVAEDIGLVYNLIVYVECKLYINKRTGSSSFRYAESRRNYTYNLSGYVKFGNIITTVPFNVNDSRTCIGGSSNNAKWNRYLLAQHNYYTNNTTVEVTGSGTITHELNGNYSSQKWINNFSW